MLEYNTCEALLKSEDLFGSVSSHIFPEKNGKGDHTAATTGADWLHKKYARRKLDVVGPDPQRGMLL